MNHCWHDEGEYLEGTCGLRSPEHCDYILSDRRRTCMLPEGHSGPHVWTDNDQIVVKFRDSGKPKENP